MGRKKGKRQSDPSRDDAESTDTDHVIEKVQDASCPHVGRAVQLANIKKNLKIAWVRVGQCSSCYKEQQTRSPSSLKVTRVKNEVLRREHGGKMSKQDLKKLQLERAKEERRLAAEKLKKIKEADGLLCTDDHCSEKGNVKEECDTLSNGHETENASKQIVNCWLCMRCGVQGCDNSSKKHSLGHYKVPRSDLHCLIVNTESWIIWCYECETQISVDSHKKLFEVVEFVKKAKVQPLCNTVKPIVAPMSSSVPLISYSQTSLPSSSNKNENSKRIAGSKDSSISLLRVKGLTNLGNTCFFNSVMQSLSQTRVLTQCIGEQVNAGISFSINGSNLTYDPSDPDDTESDNIKLLDVYSDLSVKLAEAGPLMTSLAAFFQDMLGGGKSSSMNPGQLFSQVAKLCPKFRGMQQQDSHEMLRYLMDGLKNEEAKRQKSAILKYFGLSEKTAPASVPSNLKRKLQAYGRQSSHTLVDKIFSGQMVSTIVCEVCHHSSHTYEQFFDLSVTVAEDKPSKPLKIVNRVNKGHAANNISTGRKLSKKEQRKQKKMKRRGHYSFSTDDKVDDTAFEECPTNQTNDNEEKFDEDENEEKLDEDGNKQELKLEEGSKSEKVTTTSGEWEWDYGEPWEDKQALVFKTKDTESNECSDIINEGVSDSSVQLISVRTLSESEYLNEMSSDKSSISKDEDDDDNWSGSSTDGDVEDNEDNLEDKQLEKPASGKLEKLEDVLSNFSNCDPGMHDLCKSMSAMKFKDLETEDVKKVEWTARTLRTLAPRYHAAPDECSVYSCLNNFTQAELLTGSNKWACDSCTAAKHSHDEDTGSDSSSSSKKKPVVYSAASKQFLIFCPPAILTLHMKRFQQTLSGFKKVNKHVTFPVCLDLASYCSSSSYSLENVEIGQSQLLYTLYAVVEHSGSLHGGHYTAFVKLRSDDHLDLTRFYSPSLTNGNDISKLLSTMKEKIETKGAGLSNDNQTTTNKWFHVSDSSVSEVNEDKVLKCQAYLLFYERIL